MRKCASRWIAHSKPEEIIVLISWLTFRTAGSRKWVASLLTTNVRISVCPTPESAEIRSPSLRCITILKLSGRICRFLFDDGPERGGEQRASSFRRYPRPRTAQFADTGTNVVSLMVKEVIYPSGEWEEDIMRRCRW